MDLITSEQTQPLLANGKANQAAQGAIDFRPVVKLFTPDAQATWLLTEIDPDDPDSAFGWCDLGLGFPEIGYVSLAELRALRGPWGLPVEQDLYFTAKKTLSAYVEEAKNPGLTEEPKPEVEAAPEQDDSYNSPSLG